MPKILKRLSTIENFKLTETQKKKYIYTRKEDGQRFVNVSKMRTELNKILKKNNIDISKDNDESLKQSGFTREQLNKVIFDEIGVSLDYLDYDPLASQQTTLKFITFLEGGVENSKSANSETSGGGIDYSGEGKTSKKASGGASEEATNNKKTDADEVQEDIFELAAGEDGVLDKLEYDKAVNQVRTDLDGDGKVDTTKIKGALTVTDGLQTTMRAIPTLEEINVILDEERRAEDEAKKIIDEVKKENPPVEDPDDERKKNKGAGRKDDTKPIDLPNDEEIMAEVERQRKEKESPSVNINNTPINNNVSIDMNKQKVSLTEDNAQPTSVDTIPDSRKSTDNKDETQLRSDINYFFNNFGSQLKSISSQQKSVAKMSKPMLIRLHKRILGILQPKQKGDLDSSRKVGVVIDAEEYIKRKVNEVLIDNAMKGFQIPNLQPVGNLDSKKDDETKDIGSYEVKRGPDGGLNSNKEPVYRYIPTTQDEEVKEINYDYESRRGPKRLQIPKLQQRNRTTTAQREVRNNPFNKRQGGHRLNVML